MRLSINGKDRLLRSINRDDCRSLSQLNENKVMKKTEISDVLTTVEKSKGLVQKIQKVSKRILPLIEEVCRNQMIVDDSSEDNSSNEGLSSTKSNYSESLCVKKKGLSKSGGCNFSCNFPKCISTPNGEVTTEPVVDCVTC